MSKARFKRVLLKISGEALMGEGEYGIEPATVDRIAQDVKEAVEEPKTTFGTVEVRTIEVSYATPDAIEVKEGVEEGDLIVVDVEQELQDKAKVEITETQEGIF